MHVYFQQNKFLKGEVVVVEMKGNEENISHFVTMTIAICSDLLAVGMNIEEETNGLLGFRETHK